MRALGIFLAITFHLGVLLFGGVFLLNDKEKAAREEALQEMEIEEEPPKQEEEKPEEKKEEEKKDEAPPEETPQFQAAPAPDQPPGPALAPLSLSDLESLLGGAGGDSALAAEAVV